MNVDLRQYAAKVTWPVALLRSTTGSDFDTLDGAKDSPSSFALLGLVTPGLSWRAHGTFGVCTSAMRTSGLTSAGSSALSAAKPQ